MTETVIRDDAPTPVATRSTARITRTRNVQGGAPCIAGTRVTTRGPWEFHKAGYDLVQIRQQYPHCTEEQLQAAIDYEAKKAKRKDPVAKAKRNRGRTQKARGYRCEKRIETVLEPFGFRRMVMSGALGGEHSGDLARVGAQCHTCDHGREEHVPIDGCLKLLDRDAARYCQCAAFRGMREVAVARVEVKQRQDAQAFLRRALAQGDAHAVVVDPAGGQEPLFVMTLTTATHLLREAGYEVTP